MFCAKCGASLEEGTKFCTACGNPTEVSEPTPVCDNPTEVSESVPVEVIPTPAPTPKRQIIGKILSLVSMLMSIFSIALSWIPYLMLTPSIMAIGLGIAGLALKGAKGKAITGIILGAVALVICFIVSVVMETMLLLDY